MVILTRNSVTQNLIYNNFTAKVDINKVTIVVSIFTLLLMQSVNINCFSVNHSYEIMYKSYGTYHV